MATTTPNFGWPVPTSTDLVKDGAVAIESLGDAVDASLLDLKGGTTGQILAKATNTDMDFTWVTNDVGDITAVTAGTGLTGGGTSGAVSLAFDQANYGGGQYAAGKNKIINGDFGVWQRGTSFSNPQIGQYLSDRWVLDSVNAYPTTHSVSRQSFTAGTAPVAGYEGQYFFRSNVTTAGTSTYIQYAHKIENVQTFAGQTATLSFWAKGDSARVVTIYGIQAFGTGGSGAVLSTVTPGTITLSTVWQRFSVVLTVPSIAGKTIGTNSSFQIVIQQTVANGSILDLWGVQIEAGSIATPFQTATGTIQGELAACKYYFRRYGGNANFEGFGIAHATSTTAATVFIPFETGMRSTPVGTYSTASNFSINNASGSGIALTSIITDALTKMGASIALAVTSGLTAGNAAYVRANNTTSATIDFSAEL